MKPLRIRMARMLRKLANHCLNGVYAAEKTENGHEIGCVRGAKAHKEASGVSPPVGVTSEAFCV